MHGRERRATVLAIAAIALASGMARILPVSDSDAPWHVLHGQRALAAHAARYAETSSFTRYGDVFVNHEWLSDVVFAWVHRAFGWGGLSVLAGLCGAVSTALIGVLVVRAGGFRPRSVIVTALVAAACAFQLEARPQSFVLVLVPIALLLADEYASLDRPPLRAAIGLVLLQIVWAQAHSSFSLLPVLVAIPLASAAIVSGVRPVLRRAVLPLALVALFVTAPHRLGYFAMVFQHAKGDGTAHITEWQPLRLAELYPTRFNSILWLDLLLGLAVLGSFRRRSVRPDDGVRALLGLALSLTAHRFRPLWAIFLAPWSARGEAAPMETDRERALGYGAILAAIVIVALNTMNAFERGAARGWGARLDRDAFPVDATTALRNASARGRLLNAYGDGGYLSLELAGRVQIAIDGRTPVFFDDELYFLMRRTFVDPAAFATVVERWQPGLALVPRKEPMCRVLGADPGWHAVYLDDQRALFARDPAGFSVLRRLDPCAPDGSLHACGQAGALHAEIDALSALVPEAPYPLLLGAQLEIQCGGDPRRAAALAGRALGSGTRSPGSWLTAASVLARAGETAAAFGAVDLAVDLGAGLSARRLRGQLSLARGDASAAVDDLRFVVAALDDQSPPELRVEYASALTAVGDHRAAQIQLARAQWTTPKGGPVPNPTPAPTSSASGSGAPTTSAPAE